MSTDEQPAGTPAPAQAGSSEPESVFAEVRDFTAQLARSAVMVPLDLIQQAIDEAERALAIGPILDPTLFQRGAEELQTQVRLLRSFQRFRLALEGFRPPEPPA